MFESVDRASGRDGPTLRGGRLAEIHHGEFAGLTNGEIEQRFTEALTQRAADKSSCRCASAAAGDPRDDRADAVAETTRPDCRRGTHGARTPRRIVDARHQVVTDPCGEAGVLARPLGPPYGRAVQWFADVALERMQAIVARLPDAERADNALGCYFLIRRKIFAQVATVIAKARPMTMVVIRPRPEEREALIRKGRPYFSRGSFDDRVGRVAVLIQDTSDWDEIAELVTDSYRITAPKKLALSSMTRPGRALPFSAPSRKPAA